MKGVVFETCLRDTVERRCGDWTTESAGCSVADVIDQDEKNVGCVLGCLGCHEESGVGLGILEGLGDPALELGVRRRQLGPLLPRCLERQSQNEERR